jgi:SAM-dependent methyltransferase
MKEDCSKQYDKIADSYDELFVDKDSIGENNIVSSMLSGFEGSVCDIGCGTGLLLSLIDIKPDKYLGIDVSRKMVDKLISKFPKFRDSVIVDNAENHLREISQAENIVSLFGSVSYVDFEQIKNIGKTKSRLFLMFYAENYVPVTYKETGVYVEHNRYSLGLLKHIFKDCYVFRFNNYYIVKR